jgi:hypothetical protein
LLPVEPGMDVFVGPETIRAWFRRNRLILAWAHDEGRFILQKSSG